MRKLFSVAVAATMAAAMVATAVDSARAQGGPPPPPPGFRPPPPPGPPPGGPPKRRKNNAAKIGAGIAAGVVGAIILNEALKSQPSQGPRYSCRSLLRRCEDGSNWACRRYDEQCE